MNDGAIWEQTFVDLHRPDAVRILDWGHSTGYVAAAGQAVIGAGTMAFQQWFETQLHELKHGDSEKVLGKLRGLRDELAIQAVGGEEGEVLKSVRESLEYLERRREQIHYAEFCAAGYPIGSGIVESGNKLVVEARMKGAGMHWERGHVDGVVALRKVVCSDRWEEAWPRISAQLREAVKARSSMKRDERKAILAASLPAPVMAVIAGGMDLQAAMSIAPAPVVLQFIADINCSAREAWRAAAWRMASVRSRRESSIASFWPTGRMRSK